MILRGAELLLGTETGYAKTRRKSNRGAMLSLMTVQEATEKLEKQGHNIRMLPGPDGPRYAIDDYHYTGIEVIFLVKHGLKPGTLIWSRVALNSDPEIAATGMMRSVHEAYRQQGLPEGVEIYRAPARGGIVYYFSPQAARLIPKITERTPCERPDTTHMRKVEL